MFEILISALIATSTNLDALRARLPRGIQGPSEGKGCEGSGSVLGTSDLGATNWTGTNGFSSTVVNIWSIHEKGRTNAVGYIVKTGNGTLWLEGFRTTEPDVPIEESSAAKLLSSGQSFFGCFSRDFAE